MLGCCDPFGPSPERSRPTFWRACQHSLTRISALPNPSPPLFLTPYFKGKDENKQLFFIDPPDRLAPAYTSLRNRRPASLLFVDETVKPAPWFATLCSALTNPIYITCLLYNRKVNCAGVKKDKIKKKRGNLC